jgi:serine/threonine-protein kinase RsbT
MLRRQVKIQAERDVWIAVAAGVHMAREAGFSVPDCTRIETTILELARNILVHAGEGTITLALVSQRERRGLQVCAADSGPGIESVSKALQNGFSTKGSLGIGLGVAMRMMDDLAIRSHPGWGTVATAIKWNR